MKKWLLSLVFVGLLCSSCFAQFFYTQGYVVTTANDTIRGEIREVDNQLVRFRVGSNSPERDYNPSQINAYISDGITRIAGRINEQDKDTTLFMREQIKGYVSLYQLVKPDGRLTHILALPNQRLLPLRGTIALGVITSNLTECPTTSFQQRLNPQLFYNSNLYFEQIVNRYNECVKPTASVRRVRNRSGYEVGILAGFAANSWKYGATEARFNPYWNPNGVYSTYYTFVVGTFYTLASTKKLSLTIEGHLSQSKGERDVLINDPGNPATRRYYFEEKYLSFPVSLRYTFLNKGVKVYAKLGASINRPLMVKGYYYFPTSGPVSYSTDPVPIAMRPTGSIGYIIGVGVGIPVSSKRTIYAEMRFAPHFVTYGATRLANSRSIQLTVGVPIFGR